MARSLRSTVAATLAVSAALVAAAPAAGAPPAYEPFVTDFPAGEAHDEYIPFVTDFGIAPRPPGATVVIESPPASTPRPAPAAGGVDWADAGVGAGLGAALTALGAAGALLLRRRRAGGDAVGVAR
jgi:hypothetical protein